MCVCVFVCVCLVRAGVVPQRAHEKQIPSATPDSFSDGSLPGSPSHFLDPAAGEEAFWRARAAEVVPDLPDGFAEQMATLTADIQAKQKLIDRVRVCVRVWMRVRMSLRVFRRLVG